VDERLSTPAYDSSDTGQNPTVKVTHTFGGVAVGDFAAAYDWYVHLFGRVADMSPHDREAVWRLTPTASVYVVQDGEHAGHALLTLAVDDSMPTRDTSETPSSHTRAFRRRPSTALADQR
jgi:hypothetical protein